MIYAKESDYKIFYGEAPKNFDILVLKASRTIDNLTFNRIITQGFEKLTDYQQTTIKECCLEIVNFYAENPDIFDNIMSSYSINGVSMQFDYKNSLYSRNGCIIRKSTYNRLMSTNLCCGVLK